MKNIFLPLFTLSLVTVANAAMVAGDVIAVDFGAIEPATANWNAFAYDEDGDDTRVSNLVRLADGADTGVSLIVAGFSVNSGTGNAVKNIKGSGSADETIYVDAIYSNGWDDDSLIFTFTGLDDSLTYELFGGFKRESNGHQITWQVNGERVNCPSVHDFVDGYASFTGLSSLEGMLTFTITNYTAKDAVIISELSLSAQSKRVSIPEAACYPFITGLLGLIFVMLRRRRHLEK